MLEITARAATVIAHACSAQDLSESGWLRTTPNTTNNGAVRSLRAEFAAGVSRTGEAVRHGNFYRNNYVPAVEAAQLPPGTDFHSLRHTAAGMLHTWGFTEAEAMRMLGHQGPVATYRHLWRDDDLDDRVREALGATLRDARERAEARRAEAEPGDVVDLARAKRARIETGEQAAGGA